MMAPNQMMPMTAKIDAAIGSAGGESSSSRVCGSSVIGGLSAGGIKGDTCGKNNETEAFLLLQLPMTGSATAAVLASTTTTAAFTNNGTTTMGIISFLCFGIFIVSIVRRRKQNENKLYKNPPMAPFGLFECIRYMTSEQQPWFLLKAKKALGDVDTFILPLLRRPVMTGDAALAREVLTDPLSIKPKTYQEFEPFGIGSIFTRNGSYWHARRKGVAPAFSNRHVRRMNQVALDYTTKWIKEKLIPWSEAGKSFDVGEEMISVTLEALCKTAFEYDISEDEKRAFVKNSEYVLKEFLTKSINNPLRKYIGSWIPDRKKALDAARDNNRFAKKIIAHYRSNPNPLEGTIIDYLMKSPCYANDDELAADVLVYLTAGHDTTAYTMAFTLLLLARHPKEQVMVRDDIASCAAGSVEEWKKSDVLRRAIKESMRLYPVSSSGSSRVCGRDFTTKEGYTIKKGTSVVSHIMMIHRNQKVFGQDADSYRPERWIDPTDDQKSSFLVFSAGKQNCVGQSLANAELHCIIPRILSEFELEVVDEGRITWFLTLKPIGVKLRAKRVNKMM